MIRTSSCDTLRDLYLRSCQWRAADPLFVDERERLSGADVLDRSLRIARGLAALGTTKGDVVALLSKGSARHAAAWFSASLGGQLAGLQPARPRNAPTVGRNTGLVHDAELADLAKSAIAAGGDGCAQVSLGARGAAAAGWEDLLVAHPFDVVALVPAPDDLAAIILFSGSTGRPKA